MEPTRLLYCYEQKLITKEFMLDLNVRYQILFSFSFAVQLLIMTYYDIRIFKAFGQHHIFTKKIVMNIT